MLYYGVVVCGVFDLKRIVAYSTASQIVLMTVALCADCYSYCLLHCIVHALFKSLIFLTVGCFLHVVHNVQDVRLLGGILASCRYSFFVLVLALISLMGVVVFIGF